MHFEHRTTFIAFFSDDIFTDPKQKCILCASFLNFYLYLWCLEYRLLEFDHTHCTYVVLTQCLCSLHNTVSWKHTHLYTWHRAEIFSSIGSMCSRSCYELRVTNQVSQCLFFEEDKDLQTTDFTFLHNVNVRGWIIFLILTSLILERGSQF